MLKFQDSPRELRKCLNVATKERFGITLQPQLYSGSAMGGRLICSLHRVREKRLSFGSMTVGSVLPGDSYIHSKCIRNSFCDYQEIGRLT